MSKYLFGFSVIFQIGVQQNYILQKTFENHEGGEGDKIPNFSISLNVSRKIIVWTSMGPKVTRKCCLNFIYLKIFGEIK